MPTLTDTRITFCQKTIRYELTYKNIEYVVFHHVKDDEEFSDYEDDYEIWDKVANKEITDEIDDELSDDLTSFINELEN